MSRSSGLTIRQYEREDSDLSIEFVVAEAHRAQVHLSPASSASDQYVVRGRAVDISGGGMGLLLHHFLPRMCEGDVRVLEPSAAGTKRDGTPIYEVVFEQRVKVRRVLMLDHEPTYGVGVSFIDPPGDLEQRIQGVLERNHGLPDDASAERGTADA